MQEILPGIYRLPVVLPGSPLRTINDYLVLGGARNLLIDTAFNLDESEESLRGYLDQLGVSMDNTDIFLTHFHVDHSGLVARLKTDTNKVYISSRDRQLLDDFQEPTHWEWLTGSNTWMGVPPEQSLTPKKHVAYIKRPQSKVNVELIEDGEALTVGDYTLQVIDLAGHTPGLQGLWHAESGTLFCADHILDGISPNITTWDMDHDYLGIYMDNLRKVREMPVRQLCPAHQEPPADLNARIDGLIAHHEERLARTRQILASAVRPITAYDVALELKWGSSKELHQLMPQQRWFACSEALAHLQYLWFRDKLGRTMHRQVYYYSLGR